MIVLTRVDNRLIHGQVIEAWLPHLSIERLLVVDDEAAHNALMQAAMRMAVPQGVTVEIVSMEKADFAGASQDTVRTLVLLREVSSVALARAKGLPPGPLNLGNVHASAGRKAITRAVFLTGQEVDELKVLQSQGMPVSFQAVPLEKPLLLEAVG
ncbi:MAG: PTS sugar transporter subunit IIB [Myxococcaceae bacterium]